MTDRVLKSFILFNKQNVCLYRRIRKKRDETKHGKILRMKEKRPPMGFEF